MARLVYNKFANPVLPVSTYRRIPGGSAQRMTSLPRIRARDFAGQQDAEARILDAQQEQESTAETGQTPTATRSAPR